MGCGFGFRSPGVEIVEGDDFRQQVVEAETRSPGLESDGHHSMLRRAPRTPASLVGGAGD